MNIAANGSCLRATLPAFQLVPIHCSLASWGAGEAKSASWCSGRVLSQVRGFQWGFWWMRLQAHLELAVAWHMCRFISMWLSSWWGSGCHCSNLIGTCGRWISYSLVTRKHVYNPSHCFALVLTFFSFFLYLTCYQLSLVITFWQTLSLFWQLL